jgi:hypothetical protein
LIGTDGIEALAVYLASHPDAGVMIRYRSPRLPAPLLRQERSSGFDAGREEASPADRR